MYLTGLPALGLLVLRLALGVCAWLRAYTLFGPHPPSIVFAVLLALSGLMLAAGCACRTGALLALVAFPLLSGVSLTAMPRVASEYGLLFTAATIALLCLGPGSLSLDARLFGLREIALPGKENDAV